MTEKTMLYKTEYNKSWALIIGINAYQQTSPLEYARNDAEAIARLLTDSFDFAQNNIKTLFDDQATKETINGTFLEFSQDEITPDDRILVFFAGHGYTHTGKRGEVGFLVPVDGTPDNLATLVRWDELTRNADLIPAKHLLFIMDACYGGLILTRVPGPGSMRFLKDMLQRYTRQALTAGKADELVSDAGGPIAGHSVFTGHLIEALQGNAATNDGIISANGVMSYVYEKVAKDQHSRQTPHFGFVEGDGDFIFKAPILDSLKEDLETDKDVLIEMPTTISLPTQLGTPPTIIDTVKEYLSDTRFRIKLDDLVTQEIRKVLSLTSADNFPLHPQPVSAETFSDRLKRYEASVGDLESIIVLISHWGEEEHASLLEKVITHMGSEQEISSGVKAWLSLRWYPLMLLIYSGGIAALAANNYSNLMALFTTKVGPRYTGEETEEVVLPTFGEISNTHGAFKMLPGHERHYVPRSEYLFKFLQPNLDDLLFLGKSYERLFDRFEMLLALVYADLRKSSLGLWGPPGRFAWKHRERLEASPFNKLIEEAQQQGNNWAPLRAGLFNSSLDQFLEVATAYKKILDKLGWW